MRRKLGTLIANYLSLLLEPVIGYSRVVSLTKLILLSLAFLLLLTLVITPFVNPVHDNFRLTYSNVESGLGAEEDPRMLHPRFQGVDASDQPYTISADYAEQQNDDGVYVNNINGQLSMNDGNIISLIAHEGTINKTTKTLDLAGNISVSSTKNYEFSTNSIHIDLGQNTAYGHEPIQGKNEAAFLRADSFIVENKGDRILFKGNVKMIIYPSQVKN